MPLDVFKMYVEAASIIESQNVLVQMTVADYPNMKQSDRSKLHKKIHKMAYPDIYESQAVELNEDTLARILSNG